MIDYIAAKNIDDRILERTVRALEEGKLAAFPTDTSWAIACSLDSKEGIRRMKRIAGERDERHFTLICAQIAQIGDYCSLDNTRFRLIKRLVPGPYVFVLKTLLGTEKALDIKRKELGVRIPDHPVPRAIVEALKSPLYSITAKRTMSEAGTPEFDGAEEEELFDGGWELEGIEGIDVILDSGEERPRLLSTVLDLSGDEITLIRAGAGEWPR
ncbi:MAG: L-threonylcarbamoyladenylate synthase [Treponemataceae bacterium]